MKARSYAIYVARCSSLPAQNRYPLYDLDGKADHHYSERFTCKLLDASLGYVHSLS